MSSENEMIDQPGDDEPEIESAAQQPEPAAETAPHFASEGDAVEADAEDGWEAWMNTLPEEEEVAVPSPEVVAEYTIEPDNEETVASAVEENAEPIDEDTTTAAVEQSAEPIDGDTSAAAAEQNTEPTGEKTTEAVEESETLLDTDEEPVDEEPVDQEDEDSSAEEEAEAPEAAADEAETSDANNPEPPPQPAKPRKPRRDGMTTEHVITYFAPCGRCGFFLSGYRALYGLDALETAVSEAKSGWLTLKWGQEMQELILKSYGSRIEPNDLLFDGCCSECRRAFVYKSARSEKKPATFRIEIKPRKRQ